MVISDFLHIYHKAGYGYGRITTVDSSRNASFWRGRPSRVGTFLPAVKNMSDEMKNRYVEYLNAWRIRTWITAR